MMYMTHVGHYFGAQSAFLKRKDEIPSQKAQYAGLAVSVYGLFLAFIYPVTLKSALRKQCEPRKGKKMV